MVIESRYKRLEFVFSPHRHVVVISRLSTRQILLNRREVILREAQLVRDEVVESTILILYTSDERLPARFPQTH